MVPGDEWPSSPQAEWPTSPQAEWPSSRQSESPPEGPAPPVDAPPDGGRDRRPTERLAIWSLLCSIVGLVGGIGAIAGIVLGFRARARIIRAEGAIRGGRLALAGIITGFAVLAYFALALVVALVPDSTPKSADAALARSQLIPAYAYPSGFVDEGPATKQAHASYFYGWDGQLMPLLKCLGAPDSNIDTQPVEAAADAFESRDAFVNSTVDVFPTTADAESDADAAANVKALSCKFRLGGPTLAKDLGPGLGPTEQNRLHALGVRTLGRLGSSEVWSMTYTYRGQTNTYYNDWVTVHKGRSESKFWIIEPNGPASSSLVEQFVVAAEEYMTSR